MCHYCFNGSSTELFALHRQLTAWPDGGQASHCFGAAEGRKVSFAPNMAHRQPGTHCDQIFRASGVLSAM